MKTQTLELLDYEKRNWALLEDLTKKHSPLKSYDTEENYYKGIITPISWCKNGMPVKHSLFMEEGIEMVLEPHNEEICFLGYSNKTVLIKGALSQSDFLGDYLLHVTEPPILGIDLKHSG